MSKQAWPGKSASANAISARLGTAPRTGHHNALSDVAMMAQHFHDIASILIDRRL